MPSSAIAFRTVCGSFYFVFQFFMEKRVIEKIKLRTRLVCVKNCTQSVLIGSVLSYLFWGSLLLLRAGDVESNPGPMEKGDKTVVSMKQTRLSTRSGEKPGSSGGDNSSPLQPRPQDFCLGDVMVKLNGMDAAMNGKLDCVRDDVRHIKEKFTALEAEVTTLKEEMKHIRAESERTKVENKQLKDKINELETKVDDLECRSKRNNLLFFGLDRDKQETRESCEHKLKDLLRNKLELNSNVEFDRIHRLNPKPNSPLIVCCTYYKDKLNILKARKKLKGSNIFIGEDFSRKVRDVRKTLSKHLQELKRKGCSVGMVYDHLIVDGKKFFLSNDGNNLVEFK